MSNQSEFDFTIPKFPAPLRRWLVSNVIVSKFIVSYKVKCVLIGPFLYLLGVLVSFFAGTFSEYLWSYPTCLAFLTSSLALCVLVYACKQVIPTINGVAATIGHSKDDEFQAFTSTLKTERTWRGRRIRYWYYIHIIIFIVAFVVAAYLGLFGPPIWVVSAAQNVSWMIQIYYYLVAAPALGYIVGNCFNLGMEYAYLVNYYSKTFVKDNLVKLFPPEEIGGLKPIGSLAWKVDIAAVIPVIFGLSLLLDNWIREGITLLDRPGSVLILALYVIFLAVIFVYPIWPVHTALALAKKKAIAQSNLLIREKSDIKLLENPAKYKALDNLLLVNKKLRKFRTWPLDLPSSIGSVITIFFPIISGAILNWIKGILNLA